VEAGAEWAAYAGADLDIGVGFVPLVLSASESWITEAIGPRWALRCNGAPVSSYVRPSHAKCHTNFSLSAKTMRRFSQPHPDGRPRKSLPSTG
jgi:hypothetical protein